MIRKLFTYNQVDEAFTYWVDIMNNNASQLTPLMEFIENLGLSDRAKDSVIATYGSEQNFIDMVNSIIILEVCLKSQASIQARLAIFGMPSRFYFIDKVFIYTMMVMGDFEEALDLEELAKDYKKTTPDLWLDIRDIKNDTIWNAFIDGFNKKEFVGYHSEKTRSVIIKLSPRNTNVHVLRLMNIIGLYI